MSNQPAAAGVVMVGGYPMFGIQDSAGTKVAPFGQYVWWANGGTSGLWIPAPTDANGNPLTSVTNAPLSAPVTMQNAAGALGAGTVLNTNGYGVALLAISFSTTPTAWIGTITFEGYGPDGNWYPINARLKGASNTPSSTATGGTGLYSINCRGVQQVRARISAYTAGTVTVTGQAQALPASSADEIVNTSLSGSNTNDITLQNAATATGDGTVHTITTGKETITLVASGTATSFTVQFQVQGSDGNWYLTNGTNVGGNGGSGVVGTVGTNAQASSVTSFGQVFQVDLSGWKEFKASLTAVSGGNVTVAGRLTFA